MTTEEVEGVDEVAIVSARARDRAYQIRLRRLLLLVFVLLLITGTFETNFIPSSSMMPTLKPGDHILTMRSWVAYPFGRMPARGDVVIFRLPETLMAEMDAGDKSNPGNSTPADTGALAFIELLRRNILIKRVVALPGETVQVTENAVLINGKPLRENYQTIPYDSDGSDFKYAADAPFRVPENSVFVLGDNRANSEDSRYWGPLQREMISGQYMRVMYHEAGKENTDAGGGNAQP